MRIQVSVTSDFVCPWCFVGERRLANAIARLPQGIDVAVTWRPFELNPGMPPAGMDRRAYRVAKFGSWERGQALDARLASVAAADGLAFNFDRITRTPSTLPAHRLMWLAAVEGLDTGRLAARLLEAYFTDGRDISEPDVLADIGHGAGLEPGRARAFLASDEGAAPVRAMLAQARAEEIDGVPFFRIGAAALFGAQPAEVFEQALREAAGAA